MKPSERIKQTINSDLEKEGLVINTDEIINNHTETDLGITAVLKGIIDYLDEQYEAEETARKELKDKLVDID